MGVVIKGGKTLILKGKNSYGFGGRIFKRDVPAHNVAAEQAAYLLALTFTEKGATKPLFVEGKETDTALSVAQAKEVAEEVANTAKAATPGRRRGPKPGAGKAAEAGAASAAPTGGEGATGGDPEGGGDMTSTDLKDGGGNIESV